jgi:hypothetical protein
MIKEPLNNLLRGAIASLRGARNLAYLCDMPLFLRSVRLALTPLATVLQWFLKAAPAIAAITVALIGTPATAHRLDEYLQSTLISLDRDRVHAQLRLTPGIAVLPSVLAGMDTNADGMVSKTEQRAYARRVLRDLSLTSDGIPVRLRLVSYKFARIDDMREGLGQIEIRLSANLAHGGGERELVFENAHQNTISAYLVNSLIPRDTGLRITEQKRSYNQSYYQLRYAQDGTKPPPKNSRQR